MNFDSSIRSVRLKTQYYNSSWEPIRCVHLHPILFWWHFVPSFSNKIRVCVCLRRSRAICPVEKYTRKHGSGQCNFFARVRVSYTVFPPNRIAYGVSTHSRVTHVRLVGTKTRQLNNAFCNVSRALTAGHDDACLRPVTRCRPVLTSRL